MFILNVYFPRGTPWDRILRVLLVPKWNIPTDQWVDVKMGPFVWLSNLLSALWSLKCQKQNLYIKLNFTNSTRTIFRFPFFNLILKYLNCFDTFVIISHILGVFLLTRNISIARDWIFLMWLQTEPSVSSSSENDYCLLLWMIRKHLSWSLFIFILFVWMWHI